MTSTLAHSLQRWFTSVMPNTRTITRRRETTYDKAERILSDPARVITSATSDAPHWWKGQVVGDHGTYDAFAISEEMAALLNETYPEARNKGRVGCKCKAGWHGRLCSHMIVAEEMRLRGES